MQKIALISSLKHYDKQIHTSENLQIWDYCHNTNDFMCLILIWNVINRNRSIFQTQCGYHYNMIKGYETYILADEFINRFTKFYQKRLKTYWITAKRRASIDEFSMLLHVALFIQLGKQMCYPQDAVQSYRFTLSTTMLKFSQGKCDLIAVCHR